MLDFQQFSTPLPLAYVASIAANIGCDDVLLEPSAGTGLLGVFGELAGSSLILNDLAGTRSDLLGDLFPQAETFTLNGEQINDRLPNGLIPSVVIMNPPFSAGANVSKRNTGVTLKHLKSALSRLAPGGRLVLITGENFKPAGKWLESFTALQKQASLVFSGPLPKNVFQKHGTTFDTRLSVFDKVPADDPTLFNGLYQDVITDLSALVGILAKELPARCAAEGVSFSSVKSTIPTAIVAQKKEKVISAPIEAEELEIVLKNFEAPKNETSSSSFVPWVPQTFEIPGASAHVTQLCQSAAMASVAPPKPDYRPKLYPRLVKNGVLSDAQLETIVYAGQAHKSHINAWFTVNENRVTVSAAAEGEEGAVKFRRGFFLGDGTGAGKGRQIGGILLDNWLQGRKRGVWISGSSALLDDARRDWSDLGMDPTQIVPLNRFQAGTDIKIQEGILFTTFATIRSEGKNGSRLDQILDWCGLGFDGVIAFDEAHSMANAIVKDSDMGKGQASLQGLAGLRLQFELPEARVVYASATAGSDITDLAYGERLGIWGGADMPFPTREQFVADMDQGGIAAMEMIARDLKALGLYTSRVLSYEGVEVNPLIVNLTPKQVEVYDIYADAFQHIHQNIQSVLELIGVTTENGSSNRQAKARAMSIFESTKQRFFNAILTGMVGPELIREIEIDLAEDRAPVLQLVSTSEAVLERRLADIPPSEWKDLHIDFSPKESVIDYLQAGFPIHVYEEYEVDGDVHIRRATDSNGEDLQSREAIAIRDNLIEEIAALPTIPSVLDQVLHHFGDDVVAEVTGRKRRVLYHNGRYFVSKRSASSNVTEAQAFLDDKKKILIFSDAGGTGRSYHADIGCINQKQRAHYLVEPGWKADRAVQGLGRTKRTNQACDPVFRPVSTDVKGQRRFISTIARRLDALGAITRGQREGGSGAMFRESDNLESDYAKQALYTFYRLLYRQELECCGLDEFETRTGLKLTCEEGGLRADLPPIQRFLNRILALRIDMQNAIFDEFDQLHEGAIERAKENGTYQLGVEQLSADSLVALERKVIQIHGETGAETSLIRIERKDRHRRTDFKEALSITGARMMVNTRSKRAAVCLPYHGYKDEDGILHRRYSLVRPETEETVKADGFDETSWIDADLSLFEEYWEMEREALPEFRIVNFYMVTGLLLPLWKYMPKDNPKVRRLVLDDGERLLGRIVSGSEAQALLRNLGISDAIDISTSELWQHVLVQAGHAELTGNWKLRRSMLAGDYRAEVTGWDRHEKDGLKLLGCTTEIIQSSLRVFIPNADVLEKITLKAKVISLS